MNDELQVTGQTAPTKKRAAKAAPKTLEFDHEQEPCCQAFATPESKVDVLIRVGEIYLSPQAITNAAGKLAQFRAQQRGAK